MKKQVYDNTSVIAANDLLATEIQVGVLYVHGMRVCRTRSTRFTSCFEFFFEGGEYHNIGRLKSNNTGVKGLLADYQTAKLEEQIHANETRLDEYCLV
jgi:hypothetical protein